VTDITPSPRSSDPAKDGHEIRNTDEAGDKAPKVGEGILDEIEDAIPGDSDDDGH
jgi:hypothetical protein